MEEELKLVEQLGLVTSRELEPSIDKNWRTIIANLKRLGRWKDIEIICFGRYNLYVSKKLLNTKINIKR